MSFKGAIFRLTLGVKRCCAKARRPCNLFIVWILLGAVSYAQGLEEKYDFRIQEKTLGEALSKIVQQTDLIVLYPNELAGKAGMNPVVGRYTVSEALDILLRNTDFSGGLTENGVMYISLSGRQKQIDRENQVASGRVKKSFLAGVSAFLFGAAANTPAYAQDEGDSAGRPALEEIVVTATRREMRLQDVPISITALTQDQLDRQGLNSFLDFAEQIPSLGFNNSGGPTFQTLSLRGVGVASGGTAGGGSASTVAVYLDETPIVAPFSRNATIQPILFDIDRVEVLRGPQGTLFGASSMGGAIRYITNKPNPSEVEARVTSDLAVMDGGESYSINGMGNVPLADSFAARLVLTYRRDNGYIDRLPPSFAANPIETDIVPDPFAASVATIEQDVNSAETFGSRISFRWTPTDELSITPTIHYQRTDLDSASEADVALGEYRQVRFQDEPQSSTDEYYNLLVEYDFGFADFISSTTHLEREVTAADFLGNLAAALIGQPFDVLIANTENDLVDERVNPNELFVQEARLQSKTDGNLQWLLGLFYLDQTGGEDQNFLAPSFVAFGKDLGVFPDAAPNFAFSENTDTTQKQVAVFGEMSYTFFDELELSFGLRWTDSERGTLSFIDGALFGSSTTDRTVKFDSEITPRYHLAWRPREDFMLYGSVAKGFRLGSDQTPITGGPCVPDLIALGIDPAASGEVAGDSLWNYEIGAKSTLFGGLVTANVAGFYIDWSGIQQTVNLACGSGFVTNAGEAEIKGVELELFANPTESLVLNLGMSYTDAEAGSEGQFDIPGQDPGDALPEVPEWVVAAGAQYTYPISAGMRGYVRGNVSYRSEIYQDFAQSEALARPSYVLAGARIGVETEFWDAAIYGDNLLDEYIVYTLDNTGVEARPGRPRTWGIRVTRKF